MSTVPALAAVPYRVGALIGAGGGGEVYQAWDDDDRLVALKVAHRGDDLTAERMAREASVAARLPGRHVPALRGAGRLPDGRAWLAMEWVDGGTLGQRLTAQPWSVAAVASLGAAVARALAAAHAAGVIHRDVKPDNVMFRGDGSVVLVDLGLARGDADPAASATRCAGTPASMAPEQVLGDALTPATDLYALGALLYRLRAGRDPFSGTALEMQLAHLGQEPAPLPPSDERGAAALAALIGALLRKRPAERPPSADDVAARLAALTRWRGRAIAGRLAIAATTVAMLAVATAATPLPPLALPRPPVAMAPVAVLAPDQPWVMTDAGAVTLRARWTDQPHVGGPLRLAIELWDDDGAPLPLAGVAATVRDPAGRVTAFAGAALRALDLPTRRAGDCLVTVYAPEGDLTLAVTIPVGVRPSS